MKLWWEDSVTEEEIAKAKEKISSEFINRYNDFMRDLPNGDTIEFGRKYGIRLTEEGIQEHSKDNLKNVSWFQQWIFSGRWLPEWEREGFNRYQIWALNKQGFLSHQEYSNWNARATGKTDYYYISQKIAKEIYKESKGRR